jgi:hypothetical protein
MCSDAKDKFAFLVLDERIYGDLIFVVGNGGNGTDRQPRTFNTSIRDS